MGFTKPHDFARIYFDRKWIQAAIYRREELRAGARLRVPCIVTEYSATTLIPEGTRAKTDGYGNLVIEL